MWPKDYEDQHKNQVRAFSKVLLPILAVVGIAVGAAIALHQSEADAQETRPSQAQQTYPKNMTQFIYKTINGQQVQVNSWEDGWMTCTSVVPQSDGREAKNAAVSCVWRG